MSTVYRISIWLYKENITKTVHLNTQLIAFSKLDEQIGLIDYTNVIDI